MVEPAAVLQRRLARGQQQVLVRWKGAPAAESAWVDVEDFKAQFPEFQLGDELLLQGGEMSCTIRTTAGPTGACIKLSEFVRDKISLDRLRIKLEIELRDILRVC
jgi:hypothetical protein